MEIKWVGLQYKKAEQSLPAQSCVTSVIAIFAFVTGSVKQNKMSLPD